MPIPLGARLASYSFVSTRAARRTLAHMQRTSEEARFPWRVISMLTVYIHTTDHCQGQRKTRTLFFSSPGPAWTAGQADTKPSETEARSSRARGAYGEGFFGEGQIR